MTALFPLHESNQDCQWELLGTGCTTYGNTHVVWHGPDNVYNPPFYSGHINLFSQGDTVNQPKCHSTWGQIDVSIATLPVTSLESEEVKVCFKWTNSGY